MNRFSKLSLLAASAALLSSSMAGAATLPAPQPAVPVIADHGWTSDSDRADRYRGYRDYRHRDRVSGGDILAGAVILGGIIAIASAASNKNKNERVYRRDDPVYNDRGYTAPPPQSRNSGGSELSEAADQCSIAAEQRAGGQVDRISNIARDGNGWRVEGNVASANGSDSFLCGVTNGRIDYIQLDPAG